MNTSTYVGYCFWEFFTSYNLSRRIYVFGTKLLLRYCRVQTLPWLHAITDLGSSMTAFFIDNDGIVTPQVVDSPLLSDGLKPFQCMATVHGLLQTTCWRCTTTCRRHNPRLRMTAVGAILSTSLASHAFGMCYPESFRPTIYPLHVLSNFKQPGFLTS